MKRFVSVLVFLSCWLGSFSQNGCPLGDWDDVVVFCTDENDLGIRYPATTQLTTDFCFFRDLYEALMDSSYFSAEISFQTLSGVIGCLGYECIVTPRWLLMQVEESGDLALELTHSGNSDVDYACWGPFWGDSKNDVLRTICEDPVNSLSFIPQFRVLTQDDLNACPELANVSFTHRDHLVDDMLTQVDNPCFRGNFDRYPYMNLQDCSFSYQYTEICRIEHAEKGGWYLFLVSNYGRMGGDITIKKLGGSAIVSCKAIVDISNTGPYCEGDDIQLKVLNAPQNASYSWIGPNGFSSTEKNPVIHNSTLEDAGIYSLQLIANGVASDVVETNVIVRPAVSVDTTVVLEQGESYRYGDSVYTEPGVHTEVDAANPCGVKNVHLFFSNPEVHLNSNPSICEGEPLVLTVEQISNAQYDWILPSGQRLQNQSHELVISDADASDGGSYQLDLIVHADTFSYRTVVDVLKKQLVTIDTMVVAGDSVEFAGEMLRQAGEYQGVFQGQNGCDSVVTLRLDYYLPEITLVTNAPICEGEPLVLTVEQIPNAQYDWILPSGQRLQNQSHELVISDADASDGGSYQLDLIVHADTFSYRTVVDVLKKQLVTIDTMVVAGDSVEFAGEMLRQAGEYQGVFQGQNGCDSVVTLRLDYYLPEITLVTNAPICEGEALRVYASQDFMVDDVLWSGPNGFVSHEKTLDIPSATPQNSGQYKLTVTYFPHMVSETTIDVQVLENSSSVLYDTIVFGSQYEFDGRLLKEEGEYTQMTSSRNGCDSVTRLMLKVVADTSLTVSYDPYCCYGGSFSASVMNAQENTEYSWTGPNLFSATGTSIRIENAKEEDGGVYVVTKKQMGEVFSKSVSIYVAPRCAYDTLITFDYGESIDFNGQTIDKPGRYETVLTNAMGCDSFITLMVVCTLPSLQLVSNSPVCEGEELTIQADGEVGGASIEWIGPDGFSSNQKSISIPNVSARNQGEYKFVRRYADTLVETSIMALVREKYNEDVDVSISKGEVYDFGGELLSLAGDYEKTFVSQSGCDSIVTVHLTVVFPDTSLDILTDNPYCGGETIRLRVEPQHDYADYRWEGPQRFQSVGPEVEIENASEYNKGLYSVVMTVLGEEVRRSVEVDVRPTYVSDTTIILPYGSTYDFHGTHLVYSGIYKTSLLSSDGCDSTIYLDLTVLDYEPLKPSKYFTPNGDGLNERWVIENVEKYDQVEVTIFDRYGAVVRHYDHYENQLGWDGKDENGFDKPSTDYWYIISIPHSQEELSGNFSLIRR